MIYAAFNILSFLAPSNKKKKNLKYTLSSTRGSSALQSIFPWYVTRNEAKELKGAGVL